MRDRVATVRREALDRVGRMVAWYFDRIYGRIEGPGTVPFYCDPARVGHFAVPVTGLASGEHETLFRLLVGLAMYQARRDRLMMAQQEAMPAALVRSLTAPSILARQLRSVECDHLEPTADFESGCSVGKVGATVDCTDHPGAKCPVKAATTALKRMGDMGKLPVSAHRIFGAHEAFARMLTAAAAVDDRRLRAEAVVEQVQLVWRVGEKLANLFVSVLATPALAPGMTPWHPTLDGDHLVVIDTNVAKVLDQLRPTGANSYAGRVGWVRQAAEQLRLQRFNATVPDYSPRLVQQALYYFGSTSNRDGLGLSCRGERHCTSCAPAPCLPSRAAA